MTSATEANLSIEVALALIQPGEEFERLGALLDAARRHLQRLESESAVAAEDVETLEVMLRIEEINFKQREADPV
jgi:thioesterase domain-containing protein